MRLAGKITRSRRTMLAMAALLVAGLACPASALTIRGTVTKGTPAFPLLGQAVQLHVVRGEEELTGQTAATNARGEYQFADLKKDPSLSYFVSTEYENAFYTEGPFQGGQTADVNQNFTVYDVGRDISQVQVKNHHIILERKPDGFHVTEIMIFENRGKTAYLGTGPDHAENAGARLGLPASVQAFQAGMGGDPQTTHIRGRELSSERPIPPGVRPFSFTYRIPFSGRVDLSHRLYFPTASFVILLDDPKLKLESKGLEFAGTREQGGKQYAVYSGQGFGVGQEVPMRIGGAGFWANPRVYPWVAAPFLIVAALWFAAARGGRAREEVPAKGRPQEMPVATIPLTRPHGAPTSDADFRKAYLFLIAALDDGLERGEFTRETHALIRQNLKRRLQTLLAEEPASRAR